MAGSPKIWSATTGAAGAAAVAAALLVTPRSAHGDFVIAAPVVVDAEASSVEISVEFLGSSTPYSGTLYFLGWGDSSSLFIAASDTGTPGLGQMLFGSSTSTLGDDAIMLDGLFSPGDVLHFAYVTEPMDIPGQIFRTDVAPQAPQFAWDSSSRIFAVDDLPLVHSDLDYDDMHVRLSFTAVPAPGALAVLGLGLLARRRRRR